MHAIFDFIIGIIQFALLLAFIVGVIAFFGYNSLRALSESIRESWANIGVVGRKQVSLINQLIDVVKGYQESEKLVMLKISDDMSSASNVAHMYQQSGLVMSSVNGIAQKFPELKANEQYLKLIDNIQTCETQLERARQEYNNKVKSYNTHRSSIPTVFYSTALGFYAAPYLEFNGAEQVSDMGSLKAFDLDQDGERLNALLGQAGNKILAFSTSAIDTGKEITQKAIDTSKALMDKSSATGKTTPGQAEISCHACGKTVATNSRFCGNCGAKIVQD